MLPRPPSRDPNASAKAPARPSAARSTLGIFLTRVATYPLSVVTGLLVARVLGPDGFGVYKALAQPGSFILPLCSLGFGGSIVYFISNGRRTVSGVFATCLVVGIVQGAFVGVVMGGLWAAGWLGETAAATPSGWMLPTLLIVPVQGAVLMLTRAILGDSWYSMNNWVTLLTTTATSLLLLALVVLLRLGVTGAVVASVVANSLVLGLLLAACIRRYRPTPALDRGFVAEGLRYGVRAWPADVAIRANLRMDQFILWILATSASLGLYGLAVTISELLWMLPDSMSFVLFNKIAAESNEQRRIELTLTVHRVMFHTMLVLSIVLGAAGAWLIPILLPQFSDAVLPLALLLPGTVAMTSVKVIPKYFGAIGLPGRSSAIAVAGTVVSAPLYLTMIPLWQGLGAAIASSITYVAMALVAVWLFRRRTSIGILSLLAISPQDVVWFVRQLRSTVAVRGAK